MTYEELLWKLKHDLAQQGIEQVSTDPGWAHYIMLGIVIVVGIVLVFSCFFIVRQQTAAVVERLGRFNREAHAGFHLKIPFIERVLDAMSLQIKEHNVEVETKTKDNVFVTINVSVQIRVIKEKLQQAFYELADAEEQIESYVSDVIIARVPKLNLDDVYENREDIAAAIKSELSEAMDDFGYLIVKALINDINPDEKVKLSMNEINAAQRLRVAAAEKGEAERIVLVKQAEAEAQSKELQGKGIASQRKAIIDGLRDSVEEFQRGIPGATPQDVMSLVLVTQYFDTLKDIGAASKSSTILIPHSPGGLADIVSQIRTAIVTAEQVSAASIKQ